MVGDNQRQHDEQSDVRYLPSVPTLPRAALSAAKLSPAITVEPLYDLLNTTVRRPSNHANNSHVHLQHHNIHSITICAIATSARLGRTSDGIDACATRSSTTCGKIATQWTTNCRTNGHDNVNWLNICNLQLHV